MFEMFILGGLMAVLFRFMWTPKGRKASKAMPAWAKIAFFAVLYVWVMSL